MTSGSHSTQTAQLLNIMREKKHSLNTHAVKSIFFVLLINATNFLFKRQKNPKGYRINRTLILSAK